MLVELLTQHCPTVRRRGSEEVSILGHGFAEFVSHPSSQPGDAHVVRTKRDVHNRSEKQTNNKERRALRGLAATERTTQNTKLGKSFRSAVDTPTRGGAAIPRVPSSA